MLRVDLRKYRPMQIMQVAVAGGISAVMAGPGVETMVGFGEEAMTEAEVAEAAVVVAGAAAAAAAESYPR